MLNDVLKNLRKSNHWTQEYLAEQLNVSRQTIAKYENGETTPDIFTLKRLCNLYNVSVDDVIDSNKNNKIMVKALDKFCFGYVELDLEGKILIPEEARNVFHLKEGQKMLLLGDLKQGLALIDPVSLKELAKKILEEDK